MGNAGFRFFDPRIAEGITLTGQYFIRRVGDAIDAYIGKIVGEKVGATVYQDTDSSSGDTIININGSKMTIADFYESVPSMPTSTLNNTFVKLVNNAISHGVDSMLNLVQKPVNYVMKHRVKKRMFRIKVAGKQVTVTEDHSIMVARDGKLVEVKPNQLTSGDKIVTISGEI